MGTLNPPIEWHRRNVRADSVVANRRFASQSPPMWILLNNIIPKITNFNMLYNITLKEGASPEQLAKYVLTHRPDLIEAITGSLWLMHNAQSERRRQESGWGHQA
ncbi:MAG: hypothetical protein LQ342_006823 [Letrouitia transgressa]|nr:MAG: hypothetical protein LQ342_006823 [Letrouitia transgressa]